MADGASPPSTPDHGISPAQLAVLRDVLRPFAGHIAQACLFGSRATGRWHAGSDIDLVLFGPLTEADLDRIRTLLLESPLPVSVDVVAYALLDHDGLRAHIDRVGRPLFTAADLLA